MATPPSDEPPSAPPADLPATPKLWSGVAVGDVLANRFKILAPISSGGTATVYRCEDLHLRAPAAVKILTDVTEDARLRFLDEGRILANLKSPHLVQVLAVGEVGPPVNSDRPAMPFMALELLQGRNLDQRLRQEGPLPWREAAELLVQVAGAVADMHQVGVIHRDIKPGNIVEIGSIARRRLVKVVDRAAWARRSSAARATGSLGRRCRIGRSEPSPSTSWHARGRCSIVRLMPSDQIPALIAKLITPAYAAALNFTSQAKFNAASEDDVRNALDDGLKLVQHDAATFRVLCEIVMLMNADVEILRKLAAKWDANPDNARPDFRDVAASAAALAPAYMASTGPIRRMYIESIRGSFSPEIYTFAFGPEILDAMIRSRVLPSDIDVLDNLFKTNGMLIDLNSLRHNGLSEESANLLEACERLAAGGFVDMVQKAHDGKGQIVILHRTEAAYSSIRVAATPRGGRLLTMLKAGRGEL